MHTWEVWHIPPKSGRFEQSFVNGARNEDIPEVGLSHSSDENGESRRSEGGNKLTFPKEKHE